MLERAYLAPQINGVIRFADVDFYVEEVLPFEPAGEGEHVFLYVEKTGENTQWLVSKLAALANVKPGDVGYAGMKDRHAVTRQWFSVYLSNKPEPDWTQLEGETVRLVQLTRHLKKLKIGTVRCNRFRITVRNVDGEVGFLSEQLTRIGKEGVPNYFGEQRFGFNQQNLAAARRMFAAKRPPKRNERSLYLSAARSYLFNEVLSARLRSGVWSEVLEGDWIMLDGSHSLFPAEDEDAEVLAERLLSGDVHITGPMYGLGYEAVVGRAGQLEQEIAALHADLIEGLQHFGLKHQRRALRVIPRELQWHQPNITTLSLCFELPAGAYATSVLREVVVYDATL